jgi:hypothetical protein
VGDLRSTLFRTTVLDSAAYRSWRERPNLFLRGIVLIVVVSLVAGLASFGVTLVQKVRPVNIAAIEQRMNTWLEMQSQFMPGIQDPEEARIMKQTMDAIVPMVTELAQLQAPLPRGISGLLSALGDWLSRALAALGGWLFYGALVLLFVNLFGGSARLPEFLGMVSLYSIPGLLAFFRPIPYLGGLLVFIGTVWSIVIYIKATQAATNLDGGRATLAVLAPFVALVVLALLAVILWIVWLVIVF